MYKSVACEEVREGESAGSPGVWWAPGVGANGDVGKSIEFIDVIVCSINYEDRASSHTKYRQIFTIDRARKVQDLWRTTVTARRGD